MTDASNRRSPRSIITIAIAVGIAVAALALIVVPNMSGHKNPVRAAVFRSDVSTIDPAALIPQVTELPVGSSVESNAYVTTAQASQRNQTSLQFLRGSGREIGFERDFRVPRYGEIDVEVVRFKSHAGMGKAYQYFLGLPGSQGLSAVSVRGVGEHAAVVTSPGAAFVEFMRGRYYAVITTIPASRRAVRYIHTLARRLDDHILHFRPRV